MANDRSPPPRVFPGTWSQSGNHLLDLQRPRPEPESHADSPVRSRQSVPSPADEAARRSSRRCNRALLSPEVRRENEFPVESPQSRPYRLREPPSPCAAAAVPFAAQSTSLDRRCKKNDPSLKR